MLQSLAMNLPSSWQGVGQDGRSQQKPLLLQLASSKDMVPSALPVQQAAERIEQLWPNARHGTAYLETPCRDARKAGVPTAGLFKKGRCRWCLNLFCSLDDFHWLLAVMWMSRWNI